MKTGKPQNKGDSNNLKKRSWRPIEPKKVHLKPGDGHDLSSYRTTTRSRAGSIQYLTISYLLLSLLTRLIDMSHRLNTPQRSLSRIVTTASPSPRTTRRAPPPPPTPKSRRSIPRRIPVTQIATVESIEDPFSDFHSSDLSFDDEFDPRPSYKSTRTISARIWQLQNIPCPEDRSKLVAGKIINRGGRAMRYFKGPSHYVRSSLSNVIIVSGDD
jgi:hypothetical protein